jgi:hypothetical protein
MVTGSILRFVSTGKEISMNYGDVLCKANGHEQIYFEQFGSYQGDWILISRKDETVYIWKDTYGSCSGCDSLEGFREYEEDDKFWTDENLKKFSDDYKPFAEIDTDVFYELLKSRKLSEVMPANTRLEFHDSDYNDMESSDVFKRIEEDLLKKAV